jgi:hypothetical protein
MPQRAVVLCLAIVACLALAATALMRAPGQASRSAASAVTPLPADAGVLQPGDPIPTLRGEPVLRIRGLGGAQALRLDIAALDRMPQVEVTLDEPFVGRSMTFTGVPFADFVEITGIPAGARLEMSALDDYSVDLAVADLVDGNAVLATRTDGQELAVDGGGPTRLVFASPTGVGANSDNWIWSIETIEVR